MNKILKAFSIIVFLFCCNSIKAQQSTLTYSDTVCVYQDVNLLSSNKTAASYYWGTCSAWLERMPTGGVVASNAPLNGPTPIILLNDAGNNYLFTVNYNAPCDLVRFDLNGSLKNIPIPVNLGNFGNKIPTKCTGIDIVKVGGNWIGYAIGDYGVDAMLTRLEFGTSLSNTPTVTNLGNLGGALVGPQDIHIFQNGINWYAYYLDGLTGSLVRLDFSTSLLNTPTKNDLGTLGGVLSYPTAIKFVKQFNSYYGFVVNRLSATLTRLDFGTSLLNTPMVFPLGSFGGKFSSPRDINFCFDDQKYYGYVTNEATNDLVLLKFGSNISNIPNASSLGNFAAFNGPRSITPLIREKDNVYGFVTNYQTNTISLVHYDSSVNATILKDATSQIPTYQYTSAGLYNIYIKTTNSDGVVNEEQHRIQVLDKPKIDFPLDTMICQGDTLFMVANGHELKSILWDPTYNLLYRNDTTSVYIYPQEDFTYHVRMTYNYGCIVDTSVKIKVSKIVADAGQDRIVGDGAVTVLGGPNLSQGYQFKYEWTPNIYIEDANNTVPYLNVRVKDTVQYYYLKVTNLDGCVRYDTVAVTNFCGDINCANAFNPTGLDIQNRTFGIANYELKTLTYFRIFNRFGEMVFETTNPATKWDGNFKNQPQNLGTYVWEAEGICINGRKVKRSGNVLLVR